MTCKNCGATIENENGICQECNTIQSAKKGKRIILYLLLCVLLGGVITILSFWGLDTYKNNKRVTAIKDINAAVNNLDYQKIKSYTADMSILEYESFFQMTFGKTLYTARYSQSVT